MLGIRKIDIAKTTHWYDCWVDVMGAMIGIAVGLIGILSFGRLTADWEAAWYHSH